MNQNDLIAAASALIAVISLFANIVVIRRQTRIQAEQVGATLDGEKARWLAQVLDSFGEAAALVQSRLGVYTDQEFTRRHLMLAHRISALADQGRLYFPNLAPESRGAHKSAAFRGARRPVLDAVILAHDVVRCLDRLRDVEEAELLDIMFDLRRVVVSEVQYSADPRRRDAILAQARRMPKEQTSVSGDEMGALLDRVAQLPIRKVSFEHQPARGGP